MKTQLRIIAMMTLIASSSSAFAGVLTSEWTEGISRYCEYSDGVVFKIGFGSVCPRTN